MDLLERIRAQHACEHLILHFVRRLDLGDPSAVADLFTEDGTWEWPAGGRLVSGREALRAYFGSRPDDRLSRRLMTNILVTVDSPETATGTSYFATHRVDGHRGGLVPAGPPVQVGDYTDTFRRVDGKWLLATRVLNLPFGGPTPTVGGE
ncbi:nuclear transport factor 2 family protein [Streptomyces sp. NPDC006739]|uniref:nuclear transport factor 2 family protein n=1 Tax=Streptomyces sp. NPDC006739 TaxID=3364763 RepID=UPI0036A6BEB3